MLLQLRPDDSSLDTGPLAVDYPNLLEALLDGEVEVVADQGLGVAGQERVEVEDIFDRKLHQLGVVVVGYPRHRATLCCAVLHSCPQGADSRLPRPMALMRSALTVLALSVLVAACSRSPAGPVAGWPVGWTVAGTAGGIVPLLDRLSGFEGTPLGGATAAAAARVSSCEIIEARCDEAPGCSLVESLRCAEADLPAPVRDQMVGALWVAGYRDPTSELELLVRATGDPSTPTLEMTLRGGDDGPLGLLIPGAEGPGPAQLSESGALIHARVRPRAGIDLGAFVDIDGMSDKLFRLKADLFAGSTLAGTWELAVYLPVAGQEIPPAALAIDFTNRERAVAGMERFLQDVMRTWPVRRADWEADGWAGACFRNLNLLPELAPCYVATDHSLILGWNAESVSLGLGAERPAHPGERSWARLYMDRLPEADERFRRASGAETGAATTYPWRLVVAEGLEVEGRVEVEIRVDGGPL